MSNLARLTFFVALCCAVSSSADVSTSRTPFCDTCKCFNQTATNPDVDCTEILILTTLYAPSMWFENVENRTIMFSINSLVLRNVNLRQLNETFPPSNLKKLDLSGNNMNAIADEVFQNLQNMEELILSHNNLESIGPHVFKGMRLDGYDYPLRSLRVLRLDHNNFHTLDGDMFQHIERNVEELYLGNNPLKALDTSTVIAIGGIIDLKVLDLSYTEITDLPDNFLHTPKDLVRLDLTGNKLTSIPKTLAQAHVIEELIMDRNPIVELDELNSFPTMTTLKTLHMCNMINLTVVNGHALAGLTNLEELIIANNPRLHKIHSNALITSNVETFVWPPIKKLDVSNNELSHLNFTFLGDWQRLSYLDLRGNPWTCECENQWMIDEMMPIYLGINKDERELKELTCGAPIEMEGKTFFDLFERKAVLRCLDLYGNRPENDGTMLIGMLLGVLLGIPCILFIIYAYQRHWFGLFDSSPAAYSRQFYKQQSMREEF